jgi:hypothetical protein
LSMGWTMKGMTPRPIPVTIHFLAVSATPGSALASPTREAAQIRLMRKPESMNVCYRTRTICGSHLAL